MGKRHSDHAERTKQRPTGTLGVISKHQIQSNNAVIRPHIEPVRVDAHQHRLRRGDLQRVRDQTAQGIGMMAVDQRTELGFRICKRVRHHHRLAVN